jgi:flagellar hook-basal body complex protein FliE
MEGPGAASLLKTQLSPETSAAGGSGASQVQGTDFSNLLDKMVQEVNHKQAAASETVSALQSGQAVSLHQAMIAMEEANVSFQLMVEVRNKLLESYQELMRLQI